MLENLSAMVSAWPFGVFVLAIGLCVGSFLNVVVYRLPAGLSIMWPGSHCMTCQAPVAWYDNIPVLSYLILGGRCRRCEAKFSARYMLVELVTGLIFLGYWLAFFRFGIRAGADQLPVYLVYMVLAGALLASGIIDFDRKEIYVGVTNFALIVALVGSFLWPEIQAVGCYGYHRGLLPEDILPHWTTWDRTDALVLSLLGAGVGAGLITVTRFLGTVAFRKEAMGTGDAYMMAAIGATLGPAAAVLVFMVAPFMGLPYGIWQVFRGRRGRSAASAGGQGGGSAAEESPDDLPPVKIHVGAFLTTALGAVMLILAAVVARPEWNTRARIFLVMGILACGLGFYLLGREEDRDREAEEAAAREAEKKASRDGKSGRGGTGGKPAAPGPDEAAEDSHEVPYGPFLGAAAGLVMLIQDYCLAQFGPGIHGIWNAIVGG